MLAKIIIRKGVRNSFIYSCKQTMSPFTSILSFFQCLPGVFILRNHLPPPPMENHFSKKNFFGGLFANWDVTEISCIKCQEGWNNLPLENTFKKINPAKMLMYLNASCWINPAKMLMYLNASCWINPAKMLLVPECIMLNKPR